MKSRWPGASKIVNDVFPVSNLFVAMSIVTPRARSSVPWSRTHARVNDDLPIFSASLWYRSIVLWSTTLRSYSKRPISVLFPASTWPIEIRLNLPFHNSTHTYNHKVRGILRFCLLELRQNIKIFTSSPRDMINFHRLHPTSYLIHLLLPTSLQMSLSSCPGSCLMISVISLVSQGSSNLSTAPL